MPLHNVTETMEIIVKISSAILNQINQSTFGEDFIVYIVLQPSGTNETSIWEKMHTEPRDLHSSRLLLITCVTLDNAPPQEPQPPHLFMKNNVLCPAYLSC